MTLCCQVTFFFKNVGIRGSLEFYFSEFVFAGRCHFVATSCDRKFVPHRRARTLQPLRESTYQGIALLTFPHIWLSGLLVREPFKNVLADFVRQGGTPPPTPLTDNHFAKKTLAEKGGTPTPPLTESPLSFSGNFFS